MPVKATPKAQILDRYDFLIVGSGIGGLVLGNYLIKEGYTVLIIEQHYLVGGCCTTFSRGKYYFNAAACHLANMGPNEPFRGLLQELHCLDELHISLFKENDLIIKNLDKGQKDYFLISPSMEISKNRFIESFPQKKSNIISFFDFLFSPNFKFEIFTNEKLRGLSFFQLLTDFGFNEEMIEIFDALFLIYYTNDSRDIHPYVAKLLLESTVFSTRGIPQSNQLQDLSDLLANKFIQYGGHLLLSTSVENMFLENDGKKIKYLQDQDRNEYFSDYVVANTHPGKVYEWIKNKNELIDIQIDKSKKLTLSKSFIMNYVGSKNDDLLRIDTNYNKNSFSNIIALKKEVSEDLGFWKKNFLYATKPYKQKNGYGVSTFVGINHNKTSIDLDHKINSQVKSKKMINEIVKIDKSEIDEMNTAYPSTIEFYTRNVAGSVYGFSFLPQSDLKDYFKNKCKLIDNLYFVGHWVGPAGVDQVALGAKKLFKQLLRQRIDKE